MKNVLNILHSPIFLLGIIFFNTNQISYSEENFPKFLTLPYVKINVGFYNGWYYKNGDAHYGIDYTLDNDVIVAAADGIVERVIVNTERYQRLADAPNPTAAYGTNIIINHANGFKTLYAHLNVVLVKKNQNVKRGQQIGISGNNGFSTEPHLHFEVRGPSFGSPVASAYDIPKYDPYGIYSIDISLYTSNSMNDTMRLWTSNPPSYASPVASLSNYSVIKFTDSEKIYYYSNYQLWHIVNNTVYRLLGFTDYILLEQDKRNDYVIRETIPSIDGPPIKVTSYQVVDKIGPNTIRKRTVPENALYHLGPDNKMHRFGCWSLYSKFGYHKEGDPSYKNICEITQDVFDLYGEGDPLVVGMFSDGDSGWKNSGDEKSPLFVNEFLIKGGENTLGYPFKDEDDKGEGGSIYVHKWPDDSGTNNVIIQNFKNYGPNKYGTDGETALIYNRGQGKCWLLKEGFWGLYKPSKSTNDPSQEYLTFLFGPHDLGAPTSDELIDNKTGETVQKFDRGELRFKAKWFGRDKYSILWYNNPPNGRLANQEYQLVPS